MTDMVEVVMRNQYGRKRVHCQVILLKNLLQTSQAHSCIYDDATALSTEIVAVSAASAGKTHELYHQQPPSNVVAINASRSVPGS